MKLSKKSELPKKTCSFRISAENLEWLTQRAEADRRSLSNTLDLLIEDVRHAEEIVDQMREEITT